jgi:hypothetical protein
VIYHAIIYSVMLPLTLFTTIAGYGHTQTMLGRKVEGGNATTRSTRLSHGEAIFIFGCRTQCHVSPLSELVVIFGLLQPPRAALASCWLSRRWWQTHM